MELRHLKYFLAVAEELHFRKAAAKLFIVQPALSRQISQLEKELDVELFKRNNRSVTLTEAGAFFKKEVEGVFVLLEQAAIKARQIETGSIGKIRIGYVPSAMHNILPQVIKKLQKSQPGLHFEFSQMTAVSQVEMLKAGKIDIGFLRVPRIDKEIEDRVVFTETYSVVVPAGHPIDKKNFTGLGQFAEEDFILTPRSVGEKYFDNIFALCTAAGFAPNIVHESVSEHATIKLVENNMGISIVPTSFIKGFTADVKFIELDKIPERLQLSMAWKVNSNNQSLLKMIDVIKSII